jgi:hypothetical protein
MKKPATDSPNKNRKHIRVAPDQPEEQFRAIGDLPGKAIYSQKEMFP